MTPLPCFHCSRVWPASDALTPHAGPVPRSPGSNHRRAPTEDTARPREAARTKDESGARAPAPTDRPRRPTPPAAHRPPPRAPRPRLSPHPRGALAEPEPEPGPASATAHDPGSKRAREAMHRPTGHYSLVLAPGTRHPTCDTRGAGLRRGRRGVARPLRRASGCRRWCQLQGESLSAHLDQPALGDWSQLTRQ